MDEWNTRQHNKSGLVERVKNSPHDVAKAESLILEFVERFVPKGKSPMCGSGICQDRRFMHRLMSTLEQYFMYRNLDVSTVKELVKHWAPEKEEYSKESKHLALEDIRDSINELKFYREHFFNI